MEKSEGHDVARASSVHCLKVARVVSHATTIWGTIRSLKQHTVLLSNFSIAVDMGVWDWVD